MKTNANNASSPNERLSKDGKSILQGQLHSESLRQRRPPEFPKLVFLETTQSPNEFRNGKHTKEFYIRFGLLSESSEPK